MNIQTESYNLAKKPKKEDVAKLIEKLYGANPDIRAELAFIYKFFEPAAPKTPKTVFEWVALACAPKHSARSNLFFVYSNGAGLIAATDGSRLHVAPIEQAYRKMKEMGQ